ncbi:lytic transglycosylase domain-containing protein [Clostridium botulinum]|uniref:Lytic transglycosylase domain-containing protein n=1 Tax=Clostridium botulinum TaxID=1491 RepID=A0A6B4JSK4_CLOBO|nr:lytic transglycosylase domain-containing protein [Clostridium botulinum]EES50438.1 lytic murein transglycosylase [Clostridium botulinum E1 str. 'BoNT E Beluga']MBY6762896.1 lytic transglycosylase domain-containing protein [Clostridium botulinum]MBY6921778.1 lytic transglycosylase domain-containing protein [Clostridium botulinum]MCR1132798.1 lytic transglycosylase domain-containing protein [Clostridium botulinum]NFJ59565.1 lytic transglycosylase domain-containing protein [Clostridium botulin
MSIDNLNSFSNELMALTAISNSGSTSNDKNNSGTNGLEFALVMQALADKSNESTNESNKDSNTLEAMKSLENTNTTPGQRLDYMKMVLNENLTSKINSSSTISTVNLDTDDESKKRIYKAVEEASRKYGVDSNLILGIIKQESDFNPNVVSSAGAMGLMQLMPENCKEDGVSDPFNIEQNINGGVKQLKGYIDRYNGNVEMALMAYNAGPGTMQKRGVTSVEHLYKMPKETQNYIPKVMGYYKGGI